MTALEISIAWRYLRSRRGTRLLSLISVIAIGGVLVGVSALILIMGVMNGLQRDLREKILVGSADIQVLPYTSDVRLTGWQELTKKAKRFPGVVKAAPFVQSQALIRNSSGYLTAASVVGIEPEGTPGADVTSIRSHAKLGDFHFVSPDGSKRGAVLGDKLAAKVSAFPGDTIYLIGAGSVTMNAATGAIAARIDTFFVSGVFETGMYEYDDSYLYVDLAAAQRFASLGSDVTGIAVKTADRWKAEAMADTLRSFLSQDTPVRAEDWHTQNRSLYQALKLEKLGMGVILLLIVIVAAFNIVSTLTMVVADKTREIGILRAMGMPGRSIRRIFLLQGVVVGAVGTFGGVALGLLCTLLLERYKLIPLEPSVYFIDHLPVSTEPLDVIVIIVASLSIAALATMYPASQAAKLYPVDAIRHE